MAGLFKAKIKLPGICKEMLSEFIGTFVLVLMLIGIGAQTVLSGGTAGNTLSGTLGTGMAVMMGVTVSGKMSGAHINPVMSLGLAWADKFAWKKVPAYMLSQYVGAFVAAGIGYLVYKDAFMSYDGDQYSLTTAAIYTSFPAPFIQFWNAFIDAMVSSALLVLLNLAVADRKNMDVQTGFSPILYGFLVTCIVSGYSYNDGNPMNPARDFSPRVFLLAAGWGNEVMYGGNDFAWWWVPLVAPHIGAIIGGTVYVLFIEAHHPTDEEIKASKLMELEPGTATGQLLVEESHEMTSKF